MIGCQHGRRLHEAALSMDARTAASLLQDTHRLRCVTNVRFPILWFCMPNRATFVLVTGVASFEILPSQ